mgnify:CR=1 FL=1
MGLLDSLFDTGADEANRLTQRNLDTSMAKGAQARALAQGQYAEARDLAAQGQADALGQVGQATAASAEELRDATDSMIGQMIAMKGMGTLDPMALMAANRAQQVKGLRSVYGEGGRARAGIIQNTTQANMNALANRGNQIMSSLGQDRETLASVQYQTSESPFSQIMGAGMSFAGMKAAGVFGGGGDSPFKGLPAYAQF